MWPQAGVPSGPGWNAGNGGCAGSGGQDWASYYQSMPTNQVDWGSLAQQWIALKTENTNVHTPRVNDAEPPPPAPGEEQFAQPSSLGAYTQWPPIHLPPPNVHVHEIVKQQPPLPPPPPLPATPHPNSQPEGGIADMDMDEDDDAHGSSISNHDWTTGQNSDELESKPYTHDGYYSKDLGAVSNTEGHNMNARGGYPTPSFGGPSPHPPGGGWIHKNSHQGMGRGNSNTMPQLPSLMGLPVNASRGIGEDISAYNTPHSYTVSSAMMGPMANLDAAARKKLPPWIREGLEKMEREKQKKEEEMLRKKLREEKLRKRRAEELKIDEKRKQDPGVSKFDEMNSNSESDDDIHTEYLSTSNVANDNSPKIHKQLNKETNVKKKEDGNTPSQRKRPSRFDAKQSPGDNLKDHDIDTEIEVLKETKEVPKKHLTKDEILEEMSVILKRTLTEILLEVTTEDIQSTAKEVLTSAQRQKSKSVVNAKIRANRAFKKNPISTLGLTGYGSGTDNSDSESEKSDKRSDEETSDSNSDDGLEERLRQRKRQFERTENSILDECADLEKNLEKRERLWKAKDISSDKRRHESKNSNHSDYGEKSKKSLPKVFETFSASVNAKNSNDDTEHSKKVSAKVEGQLLPLKNNESLSPYPSGASTSSSVNGDPCYSDKADSSDQEKNCHSNERQLKCLPNKKEKKQRSRKSSSSPEHETNGKPDSSNRRKVSENEREYLSVKREPEKSIRVEEHAKEAETIGKSHKSKRRSRSKEKQTTKRSRSPRSTKRTKNSRSKSRSRDRSRRKHSHRDRHRSKSIERKSSFAGQKSSSKTKRSRSRDRRSRKSRSRSTERRSRRKRHSSTSSETSTFSHASGTGHSSRRKRRDSDVSSSSKKIRKRSRS